MNTEAKFKNPEKMELSITVTMPLADWTNWLKKLRENDQTWPSNRFVNEVRDVICKAEKTFYASGDADDE